MTNQMAPWVPLLLQSLKNNPSPFTSLQFATVSSGLPSVRTVVLRGFLFDDKATNVLTFNTDLRSAKLQHQGPERHYEACFYFPGTQEQYRVRGQYLTLSLKGCESLDTAATALLREHSVHHGSTHALPSPQQLQEEVQRQWASLSRQNKAMYRRPAPGTALTDATRAQLDRIQRGVDGASPDAGLEHFGVVCLCVTAVDYLNLRGGSERTLFHHTREHRHRIRACHGHEQESDTASVDSASCIDCDSDSEPQDEPLPMWHDTDVCP
ncbi:hypothetical protein DAKH74_044520 [Maudiozyma humilis]|uniref:Pyridoxamine 5'-phosphate oxidase Alr4036 family FMN-binding domain-containing protein n=1 Tax=Maudiozyma humilis TaxID=51915 RepID=A0AAV5S469_MAUHU|nr:hypothetical protein DAKH74_044520 [Kazachstania humilis]